MYRVIATTVAIVGLAAAQTTTADQALAQASGCMACHQVDAKLVGPSYKDVAAKYNGDAAARDMLIAKVRSGSVGTWGQIPMPANTAVSDGDLAAIIDWVLAQ